MGAYPKFGSVVSCPKCGFNEAKLRELAKILPRAERLPWRWVHVAYQEPKDSEEGKLRLADPLEARWARRTMKEVETVHKRCEECGYAWNELPLDAE